ncbi:hypothetical protein GC163_23490 [bacterium]|nr:hypothetical protein [bacterium]
MVWMSLLAYSFLSAPLPALNEPHYLAKAKHYWQPEWCAGDLFLESANAHVVFYQTLGWLTLWLPLPVVAVIGRGLALGLVAIGWTKLVRQLLTQAGTALFALWFFLALQAIGNWSGEWIVGGVESKVFTYGFFFWSLAAWCEGRLITAAALAGLGISFHPVVGIWGVFAILGTMLWELCRPRSGTADFAVNSSKIWGRWAIAVNVFVLTALPGLWPAIQLITAPVDATTRYAGTYIQVFYRLAHHLDPMLFPTRAYVGYLGLIVLWIALQRFVPASLTARRLNGVIIGALIFALCGIVIGYGPRPPKEMPWFATRMHLLKFYPFRLADALVPCGMAWGATAFWWRQPRTLRQHQVLLWSVAALTLGFVTYRSQADRIAKAQDPAWQEVCTWFRETQPRDILVQTPHDRYTFKWYAARPEYVTFKDCPQDAPGIVEWNRRMLFLAKWYQQNFTDKFYSTAEMQEFHEQTGITHVVTDRLGPFEMPPVMESGPYRVYDLRSLAPAAQPAVR